MNKFNHLTNLRALNCHPTFVSAMVNGKMISVTDSAYQQSGMMRLAVNSYSDLDIEGFTYHASFVSKYYVLGERRRRSGENIIAYTGQPLSLDFICFEIIRETWELFK